MNLGQASGTLLPPETPITKSRSESFYEQAWSIILARKGNLAQDETAVAREGPWGWGAADGGRLLSPGLPGFAADLQFAEGAKNILGSK